ncbi:hypothetical protein [Cognatilysobacter bugurensis]|uniref:Uncharacterized protein n=1 Tax=Cognatilysobacter bugurensis TaxID=543356 RepID=A0A918T6W5_9GAMM|nr:hypothetical protein [Lysobacter bugurensis]GHA87531.1 hypothetical protein GCM10007067_26870 [Lysobacter bugurensis]
MRLFKSEWMFEPARAAGAFDLRRPRYGAGRATPVRAACPPLPVLDDVPALATIEHERAVLRRLAEYDRAA